MRFECATAAILFPLLAGAAAGEETIRVGLVQMDARLCDKEYNPAQQREEVLAMYRNAREVYFQVRSQPGAIGPCEKPQHRFVLRLQRLGIGEIRGCEVTEPGRWFPPGACGPRVI